MKPDTVTGCLELCLRERADKTWMRERDGDRWVDKTWRDACEEIHAAAAWLEERYGALHSNVALLSKNRPHWVLADLAIIASGNVSIPLFTTQTADTTKYILEFTDARVLILGESTNWAEVSDIVPDSVDIITLPGVEIDRPSIRWEDIVLECKGDAPAHEASHDDVISIVFTSGTTGVPKGVMHSHDTHVIPMRRTECYFTLSPNPRFLSYLPLAHVAERDLVMMHSILLGGTITFNESLETLLRDMAETRPNFFFGAPRVWEQLQQGLLAKFGSQDALDAMLEKDAEAVGLQVRQGLGLDDADYLLTAAAPTPPALIHWYERLGLQLLEGLGQTEIMVVALCTHEHRKIGSIGRVADGVEMKITDEGELLFKAEGTSVGYYKRPGKTKETFVDGWVHTGDKGYVDDDGFIFLTGRVSEYFKTIHAKFVAPVPIEKEFAKSDYLEQLCLLGRGYSKTVIVCVPSAAGRELDPVALEKDLLETAAKVNESVEKHARVGAIIISMEPWTIENEMLTPTLKLRREEVEKRFGERARELANDAAVAGKVLVERQGND